MDWVREFYSVTGTWWGPAESVITDRDRDRVDLVHRLCGDTPKRILELGCGYGNTAAAMAAAGHQVVGLEISDRADFSEQFATQLGPTSRIIKDDFYTADVDGPFDVVCYWNGFGIGSDAEQRTLLRRIADDWLTDDGRALIDVANPFVWARWDGDEERKSARPEAGYGHDLTELTTFDPVNSRFSDTWWITGRPDEQWTQSIRCYSAADLLLLLERSGLALEAIVVSGEVIDIAEPQLRVPSLLTGEHEYLAVFTRA